MMDKDIDKILQDKLETLNEKPLPNSSWNKDESWKKIHTTNRLIIPIWMRYAAAAIALILLTNYVGLRFYNQTVDELAEARFQNNKLEENNIHLQQRLIVNEEINQSLKIDTIEKPDLVAELPPITKIVYQTKYDTVFIRDTLIEIVYEYPIIDTDMEIDSLIIPDDYTYQKPELDNFTDIPYAETVYSINEPEHKIGFTFLKRRKVKDRYTISEKRLLSVKLFENNPNK